MNTLSKISIYVNWRVMAVCAIMAGVYMCIAMPQQVWADTAPTMVDYDESNWSDLAASETTGSVSWQSGDIIVVFGSAGTGLISIGTPSASGLTFATTTTVGVGTDTSTVSYLWTATAGSSGSGAVTAPESRPAFPTNRAGISVLVYRGSSGIGVANTLSNTSDDAATTISLTRGSDNSAVAVLLNDWEAVNDTAVDPSPSGGTQRLAVNVSGEFTAFLFDWGDQGAAGTTSYGITNFGPSPFRFSGIVVEIKGSSTVSPTRTMRLFSGAKIKFLNGKIKLQQR